MHPRVRSVCSRVTSAAVDASSSPVNGSSSSTSRGSWSSARSSASRCRMPREKPATGSSAVGQAGALERRVDQRRRRLEAVEAGEEQQVLGRGQLGIEVEIVASRPMRPRSAPLADARRSAPRRSTAEQRRGDRQQRRLAGAVRPEQRHDLAGLAAQRHPVERAAAAEMARHVSEAERGEVHESARSRQGAHARRHAAWRSSSA